MIVSITDIYDLPKDLKLKPESAYLRITESLYLCDLN